MKTRQEVCDKMEEVSKQIAEKEKEIEDIMLQIKVLRQYKDINRESLEKLCFEQPKIGDFWHEMYCPVLVIVDVHENNDLTICEHTKDTENNTYMFDVSRCRKITRQEFSDKIKWYKNKPEEICYRVIPERCVSIYEQWHQWFLEYVGKND